MIALVNERAGRIAAAAAVGDWLAERFGSRTAGDRAGGRGVAGRSGPGPGPFLMAVFPAVSLTGNLAWLSVRKARGRGERE